MAAHPREEVWPSEAMRGNEVCEMEVWIDDSRYGGSAYDDHYDHDYNGEKVKRGFLLDKEKENAKRENGKDQGEAKTSREDMMMMDFVMDKLQSMGLEMEEQGVEYIVGRISTLDIMGGVCGMDEGLAERLRESCGLD